MLILGVCNAHDSGAVVLKNNKLVAAVNEERFIRKKLTNSFPINSIKFVLNQVNAKPKEIDYIGCGAWKGINNEETLPILTDDIVEITKKSLVNQNIISKRINSSLKTDVIFKNKLITGLNKFGFPEDKLFFCDHHFSHALVAFIPSQFKNSLVLVADGRGDFRSLSLWLGNKNKKQPLKFLAGSSELVSLGAMYGFITKILGFIPDRHEGKVTGMSAKGKKSEIYYFLKKSLWFDKSSGKICAKYGDYYKPFLSASLEEINKLLLRDNPENFAYSVQKRLEEILIDFLKYHHSKLGLKKINLCLSGGCMANVKLNFELSKLSFVKNIYISPAMGDGGNALGGALNILSNKLNINHIKMPNLYLGSNYSSKDIKILLKKKKVNFENIKYNKISRTVELIKTNKIIGWFQGKMEYGPRALGSRSILVSACDVKINQILNKRLNRNEHMPFAPIIISDLAKKCLKGWNDSQVASKFMTICYECTSYLKMKSPAVIHVDNTVRPQVLFREDNEVLFDVLKQYYIQTGNPSIINTSFNNHEEPIVEKPQDALKSLKNNNIDFLILEDLLVKI